MAFSQQEEELCPVSFFAIQVDSFQRTKKGRLSECYQLPDTGALTEDDPFATVRAAWSLEGLSFLFTVHKAIDRAVFPQIERGDAIELFIDTRDLKSSGYNTRFCHHFFFLPESVDGTQCGEKTRFRGDESHPLCDPQKLRCEVSAARHSYELAIEIPSECLIGYDPNQFKRYGFTYRVHRPGEDPFHFSAHSREFQIEEQPSLWATVNMV